MSQFQIIPIGTIIKMFNRATFGVVIAYHHMKFRVEMVDGKTELRDIEGIRPINATDDLGDLKAPLKAIQLRAWQNEVAELDRLMQMDAVERAAEAGLFDPRKAKLGDLAGTTSHPDYEHWTCGTDHIRAQRVLRIVEAAAQFGVTVELIRALDELVYNAGIASCREALAEPMCAVPF